MEMACDRPLLFIRSKMGPVAQASLNPGSLSVFYRARLVLVAVFFGLHLGILVVWSFRLELC